MRIVTYDQIVQILLDGMEELIESGAEELRQQGHEDTGRSIKSMKKILVENSRDKIVVGITGEDYLLDLDQGVEPSQVDLSLAAEERMLDWAKRKRPTLSESNRRRFVFLTMNKAAIVGYPLDGAYLFTNNGRRLGWIEYGMEANVKRVFEVQLRIFELLVENFNEVFNDLVAAAKRAV